MIRDFVIAADFVVLNVLFCIWFQIDEHWMRLSNSDSVLAPLLMANLAMIIAQYFYSTILHEHRSTPERVLRQISYLVLLQGGLTYVITNILYYFEGQTAPSIGFTAYFTVVLYGCILLSRFAERLILKYYRRLGRNIRRVVFVGSDQSILPVYEYLVNDLSTGYRVDGYYADTTISDCPAGLIHRGTLADFERKQSSPSENITADELYCCLPVEKHGLIRNTIRYCNNHVVHFYYIPAISHSFISVLKPEGIGGTKIFTNCGDPLMVPANKLIKRLFDISLSFVALILLLPFMPIIALVIKIQSPGPIFFKQLRTGLNGSEFYCYKFRSMHVNGDADTLQATEHDPRKFTFGNFMRKTNIDEMPQFFNVIKGNMSIVGPRPHMLHHTEMYRQLIDKYMVRHFVKPGITGWSQVTGFRGETKELWQMEGRVQRDIWYIENWSIWLDIRIICKTVKQLVVHDDHAY